MIDFLIIAQTLNGLVYSMLLFLLALGLSLDFRNAVARGQSGARGLFSDGGLFWGDGL